MMPLCSGLGPLWDLPQFSNNETEIMILLCLCDAVPCPRPASYLTSIILFYNANFQQKAFVRLDSKQNKFSG